MHVGEQKMRLHFQKENEELKKNNDLVSYWGHLTTTPREAIS